MSEPWEGPIADEAREFPVLSTTVRFEGRKWTIVSDEVQFNEHVVIRDVLRHPGAAAVIALDEQDRVLLIRQYRHPLGEYMWEIPAGLLDKPGEDPLVCAQRELVEEAGFTAEEWGHLFTLALSPGSLDERIHIYRARGLTEVGREHTGEAEETDLSHAWVPLDEAVQLCLSGAIANATAVAAILGVSAS